MGFELITIHREQFTVNQSLGVLNVTTTLFAFALTVFAQAGNAASANGPLPSELAHLVTLAGDEAQLVDAMRRFDRQQQALLDWDRELAQGLADAKEEPLAAGKIQDTQRRLQLLQQGWKFVLSYYPNNAQANNYYGELLYDRLGDPNGGLQLWLLASRMDDEYALPHNNLALHYVHNGSIDRGLRHLGTALKLDPKNPDILFNGAQLYLNFFPRLEQQFDLKKDKLYKEAMRMSRDAAKYAPDDFQIVQDYAVNFFAAENFGVEADWKEASEAWQRAWALARTDDERFYSLLNEARTWKRAKQNEKSAAALDRALALRPDSDVAKRLLEEVRPATTLPPA